MAHPCIPVFSALLLAAAASAAAQVGPGSIGRVVVFGDDWATSDAAFADDAATASQFARNIADFLSPGQSGSFLIAIYQPVSYGEAFRVALENAGHSVTMRFGGVIIPADLEYLMEFDACFFAGQGPLFSAGQPVVETYIRSGGSVMISAGTGIGSSGLVEASFWNTLIDGFGLAFTPFWYGLPPVGDVMDVPLLPNASLMGRDIEYVHWNNGNGVSVLNPSNTATSIELRGDFTGNTFAPPGNVMGIAAAYITPTCGPADLVPPFGVLDLSDVTAFTGGFVSMDDFADLNNDGLLDLTDINAFVDSFLAGCA
jgi:hypothetical protein